MQKHQKCSKKLRKLEQGKRKTPATIETWVCYNRTGLWDSLMCGISSLPWLLRQGRVVRKPVNVNPGLNVNWSITFSYFKLFFTSNVWCSLISTAQNWRANNINRTLHQKVANWNQSSGEPWVSLLNRALNNPAQIFSVHITQSRAVRWGTLGTRLHTTPEEFKNATNHRSFWICVWGKLGQWREGRAGELLWL